MFCNDHRYATATKINNSNTCETWPATCTPDYIRLGISDWTHEMSELRWFRIVKRQTIYQEIIPVLQDNMYR